jgi:putative heme transporter
MARVWHRFGQAKQDEVAVSAPSQLEKKPPLEPPVIVPVAPPVIGTGRGSSAAWRSSRALAIGLIGGGGALALLWLLARPLALLITAVVIALALAPLVAWLERWLPRALAVVVVYLTVLAGFAVGGFFVVSPLIGQVQSLLVELPGLATTALDWLDRGDRFISAVPLTDTIVGQLTNLAASVVALPLTLLSSLLEVVLVIFLSIYWLLAMPAMSRFVGSLVAEKQRDEVHRLLGKVGQTMGGYVRGVAINIVLVGGLMYIGLLLIGVPFPLVFALLTGFAEVIPILGPIAAGAVVVAFTLVESPSTALLVLIFVIILQQIEGNILTPFVMHQQTDIPPLLVLIALVAGGGVGGLLGAIVAIPVAGALRVVVVELVAPAIRTAYGAAPLSDEAS